MPKMPNTRDDRSNGRGMVGVAATPTMLQSLSASAFQPRDGRRVGVSSHNLWKLFTFAPCQLKIGLMPKPSTSSRVKGQEST